MRLFSRDITPQVLSEMSQSYLQASQQSGSGTDIRQKGIIRDSAAHGSAGGSLFAWSFNEMLVGL
jgi:hypothetical protein